MTNNLDRRENEHYKVYDSDKYKFKVIDRTDDRDTRRGLEQMLYDDKKGIDDKIRPISPTNPKYDKYIRAAKEFKNNSNDN